jgi:hypothetical protein
LMPDASLKALKADLGLAPQPQISPLRTRQGQ